MLKILYRHPFPLSCFLRTVSPCLGGSCDLMLHKSVWRQVWWPKHVIPATQIASSRSAWATEFEASLGIFSTTLSQKYNIKRQLEYRSIAESLPEPNMPCLNSLCLTVFPPPLPLFSCTEPFMNPVGIVSQYPLLQDTDTHATTFWHQNRLFQIFI